MEENMKFIKGELITALETVGKFSGNGGNGIEILSKILIDGEGGAVLATNLDAFAEMPIKVTRTYQAVQCTQNDDVPEILREDLEDLTVAQLKQICVDFGIIMASNPKKDDLIQSIMMNREKYVDVYWKFLVDSTFVKIIKSLDIPKDAEIEIRCVAHILEKIDRKFVAIPTRISVGEGFKEIIVHNYADFPDAPETSSEKVTTIPGENFSRVAMVCDTADARPHICSVLFDGERGEIVGTNGKRLHVSKQVFSDYSGKFLVPAAALMSISQIAKKELVDVSIGFPKETIEKEGMFDKADGTISVFSLKNGCVVKTMNPEGEYPHYSDLFVTDESPVLVRKSEIQTVLNQANTIAGDDHAVLISFTDSGIDISLMNEEKGAFSSPQNIEYVSGKASATIAMNIRHMIDMVSCGGSEIINLFSLGNRMISENGNFMGLSMGMKTA
jgi:hypothetical protein